mgnify:CR=1 FL=1
MNRAAIPANSSSRTALNIAFPLQVKEPADEGNDNRAYREKSQSRNHTDQCFRLRHLLRSNACRCALNIRRD